VGGPLLYERVSGRCGGKIVLRPHSKNQKRAKGKRNIVRGGSEGWPPVRKECSSHEEEEQESAAAQRRVA